MFNVLSKWTLVNSTQDEGNLRRTEACVLPSNVINRLQVPAQDEVANHGRKFRSTSSRPRRFYQGQYSSYGSLLDYPASLDRVQITREYSIVQYSLLISLIRKYSLVTRYKATLYGPAIDKISICLTCPSLAATFHAWRVLFQCCRGHVRARLGSRGVAELQALPVQLFLCGEIGQRPGITSMSAENGMQP